MKYRFVVLAATVFMLVGQSVFAAASPQQCQATLAKFKELGNVSELLAQSYGYAVLPTIGKAGMGVGGPAAAVACLLAVNIPAMSPGHRYSIRQVL